MKQQIEKLYAISCKAEKVIIGLMSGTSLDGLDIAVCTCTNAGPATKLKVTHFTTVAYNTQFKNAILSVFSKKEVNLEQVCLLNKWVAVTHAEMINTALKTWGIAKEEIDLIASHGQTIYHAPLLLHGQDRYGNATLQIGDGDQLAVRTGIITLSDFRQKHIAVGGEGAPLAVYGDYLLFSKPNENRIMLNIGGIANFTFLPGTLDVAKVFSTDTGPGNGMMDMLVQRELSGIHFDIDGKIAARGNIQSTLLKALKDNSFFLKAFPKTIGPELFNLHYLENAKKMSSTENISLEDTLATLNRFTAETIIDAIHTCTMQNTYNIYASGGGMHNPVLMRHLKEGLKHCTFKNINDLHVNPDAKEAVLFAVLANECISGERLSSGNSMMPSVSMGKISFPL